ncbi:Rpn family recombination-promoting nuclease/putative transposase [Peptococcaceae bacterium]|nr:Rpn family recombination-promoting nuclease/putative transposase [Peptococcaceae bacterium]
MIETASEPKDIHDRLFKQLLETFFAEFIDLFFPEVSRLMDHSKLNFLQQEVITDVLDKEKHIIDILVETELADEEGLILIHVENKAQRVPGYNRKMFKYFARLHEKHQKKILPVVIYAHDADVTEPDNYQVAFSFMKVLDFKYLVLQLKKMSWRKYINSNNPVAAALINKMNYTEQEKVTVKMEFSRMLTRMQLDMARNTLLTAFMEKYLVLTDEQEEIFKQRVKEELTPQEVGKLEQITTSYHEEGRVEGKVEGAQTKALEVAKNLLAMGMDTEKIQQATGLSKEEVEKLVH